MTIKIQYYLTDLQHALGIGEIKNIHLADNGRGATVLRIECEESEAEEYRTIHAGAKTKARKPVKKPKAVSDEPKSLPEKLAAGAKDFLFDPERIRRQREFFGGGR